MDKYRLHISDGQNDWYEEYVFTDATQADQMVKNFNRTLRPGELRRKLLDITMLDDANNMVIKHMWGKTNLITIIARGRAYDTYKCAVCGITGKRFGIGDIIRDSKYKAKKYRSCQNT